MSVSAASPSNVTQNLPIQDVPTRRTRDRQPSTVGTTTPQLPEDPNRARRLMTLQNVQGFQKTNAAHPWSVGGEMIATETEALRRVRAGATLDFETAVAAIAINCTSVERLTELLGLLRNKGITNTAQLGQLINEADFRDFLATPVHAGLNYWLGFGLNNQLRAQIGTAVETYAKHLNPREAAVFAGLARVAVAAFGTTFGLVALTGGLPRYNPVPPPALSIEALSWSNPSMMLETLIRRNPFFNPTVNTPFEEFTLAKALGDNIASTLELSPVKAATIDAVFSYIAAMRRAYHSWGLTEARKQAILAPLGNTGPGGPVSVALVGRKFLNAADLGTTEKKIDDLQGSRWAQSALYLASTTHDVLRNSRKALLTMMLSPRSYAQLLSLYPTGFMAHLASNEPDPTKAAYFSNIANSVLILGFMSRIEIEAATTKVAKMLTGRDWTHQNAEAAAGRIASKIDTGVGTAIGAIRGLLAVGG
jgi:hypothetical protein